MYKHKPEFCIQIHFWHKLLIFMKLPVSNSCYFEKRFNQEDVL